VETDVLLEHSFNNIFDCGPRLIVWLFTHLQMLNKISTSNRTSCSNFIISGEITTFLYELGYVLGGAQIPQLQVSRLVQVRPGQSPVVTGVKKSDFCNATTLPFTRDFNLAKSNVVALQKTDFLTAATRVACPGRT